MSESRAYSEKDDKYSDDFASDEERRTPTPEKSRKNQRSSHHQYYQDRFRGRGRGAGAGGRSRGRLAKRGRGNSRNSEPIDMRRSHDTITARVLSASRNKINELRNKVEELQIQIKDLEQENRLYKKLQFRQEKAIRVIEEKENDLPSIIEKHNNEVRVLRDQNRKLKEKYDKTDRYLRDAEDELERMKVKMNKYRVLCEEKDLQEREELAKKLNKAEIDLEEKNAKIKDLEKHVKAITNNHRHELGIEVARQKELKKQVGELTEKNTQLENQLKEKEKALEYHNIYSRPPKSTQDNTPEDSPIHKPKKKSKSQTELTPRDKAKFYVEKKRAELQKKKEMKAEQDKKKKKQWDEEEREKSRNNSSPPEFMFNSVDRREDDFFNEEDEEEKLWRDRVNREKQEKEEIDKKQKTQGNSPTKGSYSYDKEELEKRHSDELKAKREREEKQRLEKEEKEKKERMDREDRERKSKQEKDLREQEQQEKERQERERQEMERKEKERKELEKAELERQAQLEKERLENDPAYQEERRKKDELLRKLNALDDSQPPNSVPLSKKPRENHRSLYNEGHESPSKRSDPKEYSFTKPINNLHQGKPAYEDISVSYIERQRQKRRPSDDDSGGYQPSFGPPKVGSGSKSSANPLTLFDDDDEPALKLNNGTVKKDKKSTDLLENLFGPQAAAVSKKETGKKAEDKDTFFLTNPSPTPASKPGSTGVTLFPWDSPSGNSKMKKSNLGDSDKKTALFGGGAALVDDNLPSTNKVLPRRQRQTNINTFAAKPSVTAISSYDDEIEEVVL